MLQIYRAAFRQPGTVAFCSAAFVARFSMAVYPIACVLLISLRTGHYGFAGLLGGIYVFANGAGNPLLGRMVDRFGQRRVVLPATAVHVAAVVVVIALARTHEPDLAFIPPVAVAGFSYLAMGSLVRARWSYVLAGRPELTTAYSLESTLDEVMFTLGPLLATVLATTLAPSYVFILAAMLVGVGSLWLVAQRDTEPPAQDAGAPPHASALRARGMVLLLCATAGMGALFASAEVTMVAFCGQHGHTGLAGLLLASFAGGSGFAGFLYGARHRAAPVLDRFRRQCVVFGLLPLLFLAGVNIAALAVIAFVVGTAIAPALITSFGLIEAMVPNAALVEGMSWLSTGLSVGYGIAAAIVGRIADAHGARPAFAVAIAAGLLVAVTGTMLHARVVAVADGAAPARIG
jgi:MFS family permease